MFDRITSVLASRPSWPWGKTKPATPKKEDHRWEAVREEILEWIGDHKRASACLFAAVFLLPSVGMNLRYGWVPTTAQVVIAQEGAPVGTTTVTALIENIQADLDHGLVANDLPWPRVVLLNRSAFEWGEWLARRRWAYELENHLSQGGRSVFEDVNLQIATANIGYPPDSWWMPSTEDNMRKAVESLSKYRDTLPALQSFDPRPDNLRQAIMIWDTMLNGAITKLAADDLWPFGGYYPFNEVKGEIRVLIAFLEATKDDFKEVTSTNRGAEKEINTAIMHLKNALKYNPWIVLQGGGLWGWGAWFPNHLAILSQDVTQAQKAMSSLVNILPK